MMAATTAQTLNVEVIVTEGSHRGWTGRVCGDRGELVCLYLYDRSGNPLGEVVAFPAAHLALYPKREELWEENQRLRREIGGMR
jgi:hypothetical protein